VLWPALDAATIDAVWADFQEESFIRYDREQIVWQTRAIASARAGEPLVAIRDDARFGLSELFIRAADRDGLFAAIVITLDRLALNIVEARVITAPSGFSLDTFRVLDASGQLSPERAARTVATLKTELARLPKLPKPAQRTEPRNARHFRVATRVSARALSATRTQLEVICRDRQGVLALMALTFARMRLRVHEARVATFGERVEDFFVLSDKDDLALDESTVKTLEANLQAALEA
jgi:[protein-PII] uridylyltransferase